MKNVLVRIHGGMQSLGQGVAYLVLLPLGIGMYFAPVVAVFYLSFIASDFIRDKTGVAWIGVPILLALYTLGALYVWPHLSLRLSSALKALWEDTPFEGKKTR